MAKVIWHAFDSEHAKALYGQWRIHSPALDYPSRIPSELPADRVLVHNDAWPARRQDTRGFRFWLQGPGGPPSVERCDCTWAPEHAEHYRVVRRL